MLLAAWYALTNSFDSAGALGFSQEASCGGAAFDLKQILVSCMLFFDHENAAAKELWPKADSGIRPQIWPLCWYWRQGTASHTVDTGFSTLGKSYVGNSSADTDSTTFFLWEENNLPDRLMMKFFLSLSCILKNKTKAIGRIITSE